LEYVQEVGKYQISKLVQKIRTLEKVANHKIQIQRRRLKLTHRDITIISNNCWGGFIYQKYGLEYRTPTIGLFFLGDDYVKFCSKLEFYLSKPIEFIP